MKGITTLPGWGQKDSQLRHCGAASEAASKGTDGWGEFVKAVSVEDFGELGVGEAEALVEVGEGGVAGQLRLRHRAQGPLQDVRDLQLPTPPV